MLEYGFLDHGTDAQNVAGLYTCNTINPIMLFGYLASNRHFFTFNNSACGNNL